MNLTWMDRLRRLERRAQAPVIDLSAETRLRLKILYRAGGASVSTVNRKVSAVKSSVRRAAADLPARERAAVDSALRSVRGIRVVRGPIRPEKMLTAEEVRLLIGRMSARGAGFVRFLYATGCRVSEALGIRLSDCREDGGTVEIEVMGKGRKARQVRIPAPLFRDLRAVYAGTAWLFETANATAYRREYVSNMIERASRRALGRTLGAHALRHSAATALIARTGKVQAVSEYLGHADPATTLRFYTHESLEDTELAALDVGERP